MPAAAAALRDLVTVGAEAMPVTSGVVVALVDGRAAHGEGVVSDAVGCPPLVEFSKSMLTSGHTLAQFS